MDGPTRRRFLLDGFDGIHGEKRDVGVAQKTILNICERDHGDEDEIV